MQLGRDPGTAREEPGKTRIHPDLLPGHDQREDLVSRQRLEVGVQNRIHPFLAAPSSSGDQGRDRAVGISIGREQDEFRSVFQTQLGAMDQLQPVLLRGHVRAHAAGERAFVGQRERRIAERRGARDELLGVRSAAQEREVRQAVRLRIFGQLN